MKDKGFILLGILFMMVLMSVTAVALNRRAGLQSKIASNQVKSVQTTFDQAAIFERAIWQLTKDPSHRTVRAHRYLDLTIATAGGKDIIETAGGDFNTDGFAVNQWIEVVFSFPDNDTYTKIIVLAVATPDTLEVTNNTLTTEGAGTGVIIDVSNRILYNDITFSSNNQITTTSGNFSTDGFSQYDKILISASTPGNDGIYTILNDVSAATDTIVVAAGSIVDGGAGGTGNATITKLISYTESYTYNGVTYSYDILDSTLAGYRDAVMVTVTIPDVTSPVKTKTAYRFHIDTLTTFGAPALNRPRKIAVDSSGNIYVADKDNHRIRKIDTAGNLTTVAGTGARGFAGDNGLATAATLDSPEGVALDSAGNIYIADTDNCKIRKVTVSTGIITRVAGLDARVCGNGADGVATDEALDKPKGVFVDGSGNLFIADTDNHRIRKVDTGGNMTTVAGDGTGDYRDDRDATSAGLKAPHSVFLDTIGHMYIADKGNHAIRRVDTAATPQITTVAGTGTGGYTGDSGPATRATLNSPEDVFVDSIGNLFIADTDNHVVRMVNAHDGIITTLAGTGSSGSTGDGEPAVSGMLDSPSGVTMASTRGGRAIYISDRNNDKIRKLTFKIARELY